jgi:(S)-2-hydroxyglutarate dehydrogenase
MTAEPTIATDPPRECDIVVVGAGIVGLAAARELTLRHPDARMAVLEREWRVAVHQTGHSSGVIHAGIYYRPGSLKARLCVEGARELYGYCERRDIPTQRNGKLIVAVDEGELGRLAELERRGRENGVAGLRRVGADEMHEIEPHARGVAALHSPETGVVDFAAVAGALARELADAGGSIHLGCGVRSTMPHGRGIEIIHARGRIAARAAVLCAGAWSDRLAVAAGASKDPRVVPFRGAFSRLRPERRHLVRTSIYPVPDPELPFLGVHLTRGLDGEVHVGPSALMVGARDAYGLRRIRGRDLIETLAWPGTWRLLRRHWRSAVAEAHRAMARGALVAELRRFVPELAPTDLVGGFAGVRAQALARDGTLVDDFVVSRTERAVHVRNAPSPAATSSLALARLIADAIEPELT